MRLIGARRVFSVYLSDLKVIGDQVRKTVRTGVTMNISVQQLDDMRKSGEAHTLLDIREVEELAAASISGALHIPMNTIPENLDKLPTDQPLVVMCHVGGRSAQVQMWLHDNGFKNAVNLEGGIHAWSLSIDPTVPQY